MYPGTSAAADSTTQAQNQSIPDFVRGYNKAESQKSGRPAHERAVNKPGKPVKTELGKNIINITFKW
jgi:hypothetical protein